MSFKEQIAADLNNILNADEVSENVTLGTGLTAIAGKAVLNVGGQSESEWRGGVCLTATAVLPKSTFPQPKPHDLLDVTNGRLYSIDHIAEESNVAWVVALVAEKKAK